MRERLHHRGRARRDFDMPLQAERQPDIAERPSPTASASAPGRRSRSRAPAGRRRRSSARRPVDRAGGRLAEAGDDAERRRLAAAGGAEQAQELAARRRRATCPSAPACRSRRSWRCRVSETSGRPAVARVVPARRPVAVDRAMAVGTLVFMSLSRSVTAGGEPSPAAPAVARGCEPTSSAPCRRPCRRYSVV